MGRRAKNKQGAPDPLGGPYTDSRPSAKKLGKRKADAEDGRRPAKKMRESDGGWKGKAQTQMKTKSGEVKEVQRPKKAQKGAAAAPATKRKIADQEEEEEEEEDSAGASSEGWEDVEDEGGLKKETKCVIFLGAVLLLKRRSQVVIPRQRRRGVHWLRGRSRGLHHGRRRGG